MDFIQHLLPTFEHLGILGYWVAFLAAFLESLAIVGTFIPGAIIVIIFGFLSAEGYFDIGDLIWFVALGAILGDVISYYLGTKGKMFFKNENKLLRLSHLETGEEFFKKHGNKSIFFGRFIGPLRAIVPFVAGLSKMNIKIFLFWNITSGVLWAIIHVLIGYFFGGTMSVVEAWMGRIGFIIMGLILVSVIFYIVYKKGKNLISFFEVFSNKNFKILFIILGTLVCLGIIFYIVFSVYNQPIPNIL